MSGTHTASNNPGYQSDTGAGSEIGLNLAGLPKSLASVSWKSPPYPTNSSNIEAEHRSGLVPALIAASIFIVFLLCLYTILWRCMVSQSHRHAKRLQKARSNKRTLPHKPVCSV